LGLAAAIIGLALAGCAPASDVAPPPPAIAPPSVVDTAPVAVEYGVASWYRPRSKKSRTATGEHFDGVALTAAHRSLPFNTMVRVINLSNGRSAVLRINDRGPRDRRRVIDVSAEAAAQLDMKRDGLASVRIEVLPAYEARSSR
jgi:rare lipoprotein A